MAPVPSVAHGSNTFIPSTEATNGLVINFSKNPSKFGIARYTQYTPIKKIKGRYVRFNVAESGRVTGDNPQQEHYWGDGNDAPMMLNREAFAYYDVETHRFVYGFALGQLAIDNADFEILGTHAAIYAQQAMTHRTHAVVSKITASGNWPSGHYAASPAAIAGSGVSGPLNVSTTNRKDIKRTFDAMFDQIRQATHDSVTQDQVHIVVSPQFAREISVCQEIVDHIKQSPTAREELENTLSPNALFGLPKKLYGYSIEIETSVKETSVQGSAPNKSNIMPNGSIVMLARPGALVGVEAAPSFSTVQCFLYEDMSVEQKYDSDNRRTLGRIVDHYGVEITCPISGFLCDGVLG